MKLSSHLSRITTPGRTFIPQIDGLRFIAILAVIAYHVRLIGMFYLSKAAPEEAGAGGLVGDVFDAGHFGVELFFALSGFILSLPFAKHYLAGGNRIRLRDYYLRRITRIEPPYLIHLAFCFLLGALVLRRLPAHADLYGTEGWAHYTGTHILTSLGYANGLVFGKYPYPNGVLWSLEMEVQFYLLAPFLAWVFAITRAWQRRALLVAVIILVPFLVSPPGGETNRIGFSLLGNLHFFLVGFLLADFYLAGWLAVARNFKWDFLILPAGAAVVFIQARSSGSAFLPWIILLACLAAFRGKTSAWFLGHPWITTIGGMCYTIYMYHWFLISALIRGTIGLQTKIMWLDLLIQLLVMLPVILLVSAVFFVLFERPFMQREWPARLRAALRHPGKTKVVV